MKPPPLNHAVARGFTLLELMVAIAVLGVLLGIGVPAFTEAIRNNRTVAVTNDLVSALNTARNEAIDRGLPISVCAANAARTNCAGVDTDSWGNGWLIFTDRTGTSGTVDGTDQVLLVSDPITPSVRLSSGNRGFVRFLPDGTLAPPAAVFQVTHERCSGINQRQITIILSGRVNTTREACS
jgi:type IV fimbrial biogenesis protein FimT